MGKVHIAGLAGVIKASVIERVHKFARGSSGGMIGDCGGWDVLEDILSGRGGRIAKHPESLVGIVLAMAETIYN